MPTPGCSHHQSPPVAHRHSCRAQMIEKRMQQEEMFGGGMGGMGGFHPGMHPGMHRQGGMGGHPGFHGFR